MIGNDNYSGIYENAKKLHYKGLITFDDINCGTLINPEVSIDANVMAYIVLGLDFLDDIDFSDTFSILKCFQKLWTLRKEDKISQKRFLVDF